MENILDIWSLAVILLSAFVIGWAAEAAQTFLPQALALTILAWLQTLPEFAVEASIAWDQQRDLMIANLTGSLRLLVGLGWPMIFFVHMFSTRMREGGMVKKIRLPDSDSLSVLFLFVSVLYFVVIWAKGSLTVYDGGVLILIYLVYLWRSTKLPPVEIESEDDLPWVARKIVVMPKFQKVSSVIALFVLGGAGLYLSVHPFIDTLQGWSVHLGISTFVFVQWVAPFLSEFPEKVSAFNWARQRNKAPLAVMNMVNSNINQWTLLAAIIPLIFNYSLGHLEPVYLEGMRSRELELTIAQSALGGLILLDLELGMWEAGALFVLWLAQFIYSPLREVITAIFIVWSILEIAKLFYRFFKHRQVPRALAAYSFSRHSLAK